MPQVPSKATAIEHGRDAVAPFARVGYASRSLIYIVIGFFAVLAAFGGGSEKGSKGALRSIMGNVAGDILTWALILGLLSYALWRLLQAVFDTEDHEANPKGLLIRAGLLGSAFSYGALCIYAYALWSGQDSGSGGHAKLATELAGFVGSRILAWAFAAVFAGIGVAHFIKAIKEHYGRYFDASPDVMRFVHPIAKTGLIARGVIFWIIAILFVYRGVGDGGGGDKPGVGSALNFIRNLPAGDILLAITGIGLLAFAAYSLAEAIWRRITF